MTDFHELYRRYAADVYRFARFLSGDAAEAEEITAETFARALTGRTPLISATVKGYLLTIARNLHVESARRRKRIAGLPPELPDARPSPDRLTEQRTELEALQRHLQNFSEVDRAALLLRADGIGYEDIALALGISVASAKVKVHRVRLKLVEWRAARS